MTSITQASLRYEEELGTFLGPQNRTQGRCDLLSCQSFEQIIVGGVPDDDGFSAGVLLQELLDGHRAVPDINVTRTRPRHHLTWVCPPTSCT